MSSEARADGLISDDPVGDVKRLEEPLPESARGPLGEANLRKPSWSSSARRLIDRVA
jgi:hypothetical protein